MPVMSPVEVFRSPQKHEGRIATGAGDPSYRAFEALYLTFIAMPVIAGIGMASGTLVNWQNYLAPAFGLSAAGGHTVIQMFGWIAMAIGALVAVNPLLGAQTVTLYLWLGVANFALTSGHKGLALCLLTMSMGSWALSQLAGEFGKRF